MNSTDARDLAVDDNGEIRIENNDLVLATGVDAIRQDIAGRLALVAGEWFLDTDAGIPLFDRVLGKNPNLGIVAAIYRETILATEGVKSIVSFSLSVDKKRRKLSIAFSVDTDLSVSTGVAPSADTPIDMVFDDITFGAPLYS